MEYDKPVRVAVYARVSTEHEAQVLALDNQLEWYTDIIEKNPNYIEVGRYIDEGITGTSAKKRPEFMRMIRDAEKGKFSLIITREVSRFARNTVDTLKYAERLKEMGVIVDFIGDKIRTDDPDGEFRLTLMASLAQDESRKISDRVKYGINMARQKGVLYGNGNILGYDRIKREVAADVFVPEYVINTEQAETVRMIFDWYLQGNGVRKIQFMLEQAGRKTAEGKTNWYASVISKTLKRKFYCGLLDYGQQYSDGYKTQKRKNNYGDKDRIIIQGSHEPIVTVEEFDKVQEIMESHRKSMPNLQTGPRPNGQKNKVDVWSKLLVCVCGHCFNRHKWAHKNSRTVYGYQCYSSVRSGTVQTRLNKGLSIEGVCTSPMVPQWKLKMMAKYVFTNFITDVDEILKTANHLLQKHIADKPVRDNTQILENKRKELTKFEKRLKNYTEMRADGEITRERFFEYKAEIEPKIEELKKVIAELEVVSEPVEEVDFGERIKMLEYAMEQLVDFENMQDIPESVVDAFVDRIVVSKDCFDWYLRFDPTVAYSCKVEGKRSGTAKVTSSFAFLEDSKTKKKYKNLSQSEYDLVASATLDIDYAKKYLYSQSTKHRIHKYEDTNVNVYV